jgi:hypothetical protein
MAKQEKSANTKRGLPAGVKAALAVVTMGAAALFGGCENETTQTIFQLNYGIMLEDQTGGALTGDHIGIINEYLSNIDSNDRNTLIGNGLNFIIVSGNTVTRDNGAITVGIDNIQNITTFAVAINNSIQDLLLTYINGNAEVPGAFFG